MSEFDLDEFLEDYQAPTATVAVCGRANLAARHAALEAKVLDQGQSDTLYDKDLAGLRDEIRQVEADMAEATREFTFRALPTLEWQDLVRAHPPTKAQQEKHGRGLDHNLATFPAAAVAACAVAPEITAEQAERMQATLFDGDWQRVWGTVRLLNTQAATAPKSVAATLIDAALASAASSTTAADGESPEASS